MDYKNFDYTTASEKFKYYNSLNPSDISNDELRSFVQLFSDLKHIVEKHKRYKPFATGMLVTGAVFTVLTLAVKAITKDRFPVVDSLAMFFASFGLTGGNSYPLHSIYTYRKLKAKTKTIGLTLDELYELIDNGKFSQFASELNKRANEQVEKLHKEIMDSIKSGGSIIQVDVEMNKRDKSMNVTLTQHKIDKEKNQDKGDKKEDGEEPSQE